MKFIFAFIFIFAPLTSHAFPEMLRAGYAKCISCHVSPSGGGVLSDYGRQAAVEILSSWGTDSEAKFLNGSISTPKDLLVGGDFRALSYNSNVPGIKHADTFPMQADVEAAFSFGNWTADATIGIQESQNNPPPDKGGLLSRRHYLMYHFNDNVSVRAGRFIPAFGIAIPEHSTVTRDNLGFGEGLETYNAELQVSGETWDVIATGILGRPDDFPLDREKGGSLSGGVFFADRFKLGASYYYGANNTQVRNVYGPWGILGITKHFYLLTELDTIMTSNLATSALASGMANYQRLDYEFFQGLHLFGSEEYIQNDLTDVTSINRVYSLGTQFFPRPHFDLQLTWQKTQNLAQASRFYDFYLLMLHYYL